MTEKCQCVECAIATHNFSKRIKMENTYASAADLANICTRTEFIILVLYIQFKAKVI